VCAAVVATTPLGGSVAHAAPMPIFVELVKPAPGPRGAVAIIGDSVMLGSAYETDGWGPSVAQMMVDRGWGPVRLKAGVGFQTGRLIPGNPGANMSRWLLDQRAAGFDPPVIMVSLGPNEIKACGGSTTCAATSIRSFMDVAGPDRQVWWSLITMTDPGEQAAWNSALLTVAGERANLLTWDWPAVQRAAGVPLAPDRIHLPDARAYRARSALMADDASARLGLARREGGPVAPPAGGAPLEYVPVPPRRVLDTREVPGARLAAGGTLRLDLRALVPGVVDAGVTAVTVNLAAADPAAPGFLTLHPCDAPRPLTASVNFPAGQPRSAQATALLDAGGTLCAFSSAPADVVVDLQGVFRSAGGHRLSPLPPTRLLDTRVAGRALVSRVEAPPGAAAVALTLTVVGDAAAGVLTAFPCGGAVPVVANVNWAPREIVSGAAFVPVGADGGVCVATNQPADVVVDLTGTFGAEGGLRFVPAPPTRMLDTRTATGGWRGPLGPLQPVDVAVAPVEAAAVTGTIVAVEPVADGWLTGTPCGTPPGATASVNAPRGGIMANSLTVGLSGAGRLCLVGFAATHAVLDVAGWWVP